MEKMDGSEMKWGISTHSAVLDTENKSLNLFFATKYVIPKSLKFSHWLSEST